jgi:hypothetical protein
MVMEVRKMFAFLQESKREFYDTQDFMNTMSDLLEIRQQQDAYEFFQHACDRYAGFGFGFGFVFSFSFGFWFQFWIRI